MDWRGFELNPATPQGGVSLEQLFGSRALAMRANAERTAAAFGVTGIRLPTRLSNTRRVLAVAEWARSQGRLLAFRDAAMEAYWQRGEDLENPEVLGRLAEHAGLPPEEARAAMDAPEYLSRVEALQEEGRAAGVSGIPTAFIGGIRVVGCQPYEVFADAARRAGARRRT